jgi:predicted nucleic acid-binding protein
VNRRLISPTNRTFDDAGAVLSRLGRRGLETRRASLVHDVLIALTCRGLGLTLYTTNATDFQVIRSIRDFKLDVVSQC